MRFYDLWLGMKELDLKDGFENQEEISKFKSIIQLSLEFKMNSV